MSVPVRVVALAVGLCIPLIALRRVNKPVGSVEMNFSGNVYQDSYMVKCERFSEQAFEAVGFA